MGAGGEEEKATGRMFRSGRRGADGGGDGDQEAGWDFDYRASAGVIELPPPSTGANHTLSSPKGQDERLPMSSSWRPPWCGCGHRSKVMQSRWLTYLAIFQVQVLFALVNVLCKPVLSYISPYSIALWRTVLSIPPLYFAAYLEGSLGRFTRADAPFLALSGFLGISIAQSTVFLANQVSGHQIVSIMQPTGPVYAALFATLLRLERMTWTKAAGILLSIAGALVILRPDTMRFGSGVGMGVIIMLVNQMAYSLFLVLMKLKMRTHPYPIGLTAHANLWGFVFLAIACLPSGLARFDDLAAMPTAVWAYILYVALGISFWASLCQTWAVKRTSATVLFLFSSLAPFLTKCLSVWLLHDRTLGALTEFIGLALNLLGLGMVIYSKARHEQPAKPVKAAVEDEEMPPLKALKLAPSLMTLSSVSSSVTLTSTLSWSMDDEGMPSLCKGSTLVVGEGEGEVAPPPSLAALGPHQSTTFVMH